MIYTFFYYLFFSSVVLFYGIGLNYSFYICENIKDFTFVLIRMLLSILFSLLPLWLFTKNVLVYFNYAEFYPIAAVLLYFPISRAFKFLIPSEEKFEFEYTVAFLIILLVLNESMTFFDVLIISTSCIVSFVSLIPLLYSIQKRLSLSENLYPRGNSKSLLLISIALIIAAIAAGNVSWLNQGVIR